MSRFSTIQLSTSVLVLFLALGLAVQPQARAQMDQSGGSTMVKIGPRVGIPVGDVSDTGGNLFFGADGRVQIASLPSEVVLNPSFDYYLTDDFLGSSLTIFAVDLNGLYEFDLDNPSFVPYGGAGIAITRISADVTGGGGFVTVDPSSTEVGLNLIGGARFPLGSVEPFAQVNFGAGAERIGIAGGVLFSL